jgi:PAS domain-containing protein
MAGCTLGPPSKRSPTRTSTFRIGISRRRPVAKLTLINPAYMTRQVLELGAQTNGIQGHITSLKPIRPENAPDPWETAALEAFERGEAERSSIEIFRGEPHLRLMRPFITEKGCLKCHASQGYQLGDVRGGVSVSVPMAPLRAVRRDSMLLIAAWHGGIWFLGLVGIGLSYRHLRARVRERKQAEKRLQQRTAELEDIRQALTDQSALLAEAMVAGDMGAWFFDVATGMFTFTDAFFAMFRTTAEAEGGHQMSPARYAERFVPPDIREVVAVEVWAALDSEDREYRRTLDHQSSSPMATRGGSRSASAWSAMQTAPLAHHPVSTRTSPIEREPSMT